MSKTTKQPTGRRARRPSPAPGSASTTPALRAKLYARLTARRAEFLKEWKEDAIHMQDFETAAMLGRAQKSLERLGETTIEPNKD